MTDEIYDEPPDENEAYENLDESLDDEDLHGAGPEGGRDVDSDLVADQTELEESGAELDDPEQMSILDGGMDDPDGSGPPPHRAGDEPEAGWDVDPASKRSAEDGDEQDYAEGNPPDPEDGEARPAATSPDEVDTDPGVWE
ncbi:MAG TPA: hypothetical protein VKV06_02080 [Acidimicrobiales bacterium]|nr:hypothetical protein [Acidimicrobiales bacterium]